MSMEAACVTDNESPHRAEALPGHSPPAAPLQMSAGSSSSMSCPEFTSGGTLLFCAQTHQEDLLRLSRFPYRQRHGGRAGLQTTCGAWWCLDPRCASAVSFLKRSSRVWAAGVRWVLNTSFLRCGLQHNPQIKAQVRGWSAATQGQPEARIF